MFTITWTTYSIGVATALAVYYLFIGFKFYFAEAKSLFNKKPRIQPQSRGDISLEQRIEPAVQNTSVKNTLQGEREDTNLLIGELIEALISFIRVASNRNYPSQEFKKALHDILSEYSSVQHSSAHSFINELIISQCEKYNSITLTDEEVELLWQD